MSRSLSDQVHHHIAVVDKTSGGGTLGGTEFGQSPGQSRAKPIDDDKSPSKVDSK